MIKVKYFPNLTSMFFPTGRPNIEEGVGRANLNLAELGLICVFFISLNSLKFLGSKHPEKFSIWYQILSLNKIYNKTRCENEREEL